jgi:hypothetical protein
VLSTVTSFALLSLYKENKIPTYSYVIVDDNIKFDNYKHNDDRIKLSFMARQMSHFVGTKNTKHKNLASYKSAPWMCAMLWQCHDKVDIHKVTNIIMS